MNGIINVQWYDNPGAVLLCYALQQKLYDLRIDNIVIDYASGGGTGKKNNIIQRILYQIPKLKKLYPVNGVLFYRLLRERHANYENFRTIYLTRTERFSDCNNPCLYNYDSYIVGSDVVWKPEIIKSNDADVYFLSFLSPESSSKRISYAASIGTSDKKILDELKQLYKERLMEFDHISVREKETNLFLHEVLKREITTVVDPVFLLRKEDYLERLELSINSDEYIYFYMLSPNCKMIDFVKKLSNETGLRIYYDMHTTENLHLMNTFDKSDKVCASDGPKEFLERIMNAKYVVTNSFHGTAFSLIFNKDFFTFGCVNNGIDISLRMKDVLVRYNLSDRFEPKNYFDIEAIDFKVLNQCIQEDRDFSINYIIKALYDD